MTASEYLEIERRAEFRSEFWDGEMHLFEGASGQHSEASVGFLAALLGRLRGSGYCVFNCLLRVRDGTQSLYAYPDVSVTRGAPVTEGDDTLVNPVLLAEVLSPSTEARDRGLKLERYLRIESVCEYVLISQHEPRVETYLRKPEGSWRYQSVEGLDASVTLSSIGIEVPLSEIYRGISFRDWFMSTSSPATN